MRWSVAVMRGSCIAAVSLTLPLLIGCAREPDPPLRIGTCPWPAYEFLHLAQERGFFEHEGVRVQLIEYSVMSDMRRAFERGQVDGITCTLIDLFLVKHQSPRTLNGFYVIDYSNGSDCLQADKSIPDVASLRGKRIGYEPGTLDLIVIYHALKSAGLTLNDVKLAPLSQQDMPEAFRKNEIDAAQGYPPYSTQIAENPRAHRLFDSSKIPGMIVDMLALDRDVLARRKTDAARLARAFVRAQEFMRDHPEEGLRSIARRAKISPAEVSEALKGIKLIAPQEQAEYFAAGGTLEQALSASAEVLVKMGWISQSGNVRDLIAAQSTPIRDNR